MGVVWEGSWLTTTFSSRRVRGLSVSDNGQKESPVSRPLVKILADMVEYVLRRDSDGLAGAVESAPKANARNGGSPA